MDIKELKEQIIVDDKIELILKELGMHHIVNHDTYYSCGVPGGDNPKSTVIYKDSLYVDAHTRNIKDRYGHSDIIALAEFIKGTYHSQCIKWICDICGYNYYADTITQSKFLAWLNNIYRMSIPQENEENTKLEPIDESVLKYFGRCGNKLFEADGISVETMYEFELGYDLYSHAITIPIRDELGTLVGIKGRLYKKHVGEYESKYFYIYPCAKNQILYGLYKTMPYIKEKNECIVAEAEKGVQQLWSHGIKNCVAISGHILSKQQVQKLTHLNVNIILAYDEGADMGTDGQIDKNFYSSEFEKFLPQQKISYIYDTTHKILNSKESPMDNIDKWYELYKKYKIEVR